MGSLIGKYALLSENLEFTGVEEGDIGKIVSDHYLNIDGILNVTLLPKGDNDTVNLSVESEKLVVLGSLENEGDILRYFSHFSNDQTEKLIWQYRNLKSV